MAGRSLLESDSIGIGTVLAAVVGAWLMNGPSGGRTAFTTPRGIAQFAFICFVPIAMISSLVAAAGLALAGEVSSTARIAIWWFADAIGTAITAPVVALWAMTPLRPIFASSLFEAAVVFVLAAAVGTVAYSPLFVGDLAGSPLTGLLPDRRLAGFLVLLPLAWTVLRGRTRDAATAALIFSATAVWGFAAGADPFQRTVSGASPLLLLPLLCISASSLSLLLAAAMATHQGTQARLLSAQDLLNDELAQTKAALDNARRHFQILIEGVVDYVIFLLDTSGHVASWNSAAQRIIGYTADEIIGKHYGIFYRPDERRAGEPNRAIELAIQKGKCEVEGWRVRKNGTPFFVAGEVTAIHDANGRLIGLANIIRDATERRDAQEKLVEAREQLATAQKMEAIGKLTGGIAHDFNNLLMIIGGNAQLFKRLLDPKLPQAIEAIQTAAKRGESLTRQLLTFSRRQHLSPTVVDLKSCIKNMRSMIESSLRGNIVYREQLGSDVWPVEVDIAELQLAIVNIAVNARDAMPNGGEFTLTAGNVPADHNLPEDCSNEALVVIGFTDTGMGIPPNLLSKIFDPFFTTKDVGKGTGLGLSQVYGFAHQAGGTVKVESQVGKGTTIAIFLPAHLHEAAALKESYAKDTPSQRPTVLIVDDSAEVAEVTSSLFECLGYDTVYRDSAEAALRLLAEGVRVDLVFSDIVMPGAIDGVGLANEIRAWNPHLPIVLATGYSDAAQAAPADLKILYKPFDTDALKGVIQDLMEDRAAA